MNLKRKTGFGKITKRRKGAKINKNTKNLVGSSDDPLYGLAIEDEDFIFKKPDFMYYEQWCYPILKIEMIYDFDK